MADEFFGEIHQLPIGGIGLIELDHGEFGIVLDRNPLITEIAVDLENAIETADHQPLQIKFRRDAQEQIHLQRIVVGDERAGRGAAGDRLHHRRFDFEKVVFDHELPDQGDNATALAKCLANLRVDDQVEIALPIAGFHIGQTVPFLREKLHRFGQQAQFFGPQREFSGFGAKRRAAHPDDVADIQLAEDLERFFTDGIAGDINLQPAMAVLQLDESCLAEIAPGHNAAGQRIGIPGTPPERQNPAHHARPTGRRRCDRRENRWRRD